MMKIPTLLKNSVFFLTLGVAAPLFADMPQAINFQAIARRPDGTPIANATVGIRATIRQSTSSGTIAYQERLTAVTTAGGQFSLQIGRGTPLSGSFFGIDWSVFSHFLELEIDPAGGTTYTNMGTQELVSVPYAQHSRTCDMVSGTTGYIARFDASDSLQSSSIYQTGSFVGINNTSPSERLDVGGNIEASGVVRAGTGVSATTGNITATAGNVVATTGELVADGNTAVVTNGGSELMVIRTTATLATTLSAGSSALSGDLSLGTFASPPVVSFGSPYQNGSNPLGDVHKLIFVTEDTDTNSCKIRVHNVSSSSATFNCRIDGVSIGVKP